MSLGGEEMDGIVSRLSSYQILSSIIPGAVLLTLLMRDGTPFFADLDSGSFLLIAYLIGLAMNRVAALLTFWDLSGEDVKILYLTYREDHLAQSVYETYAMYRTLLIALPLGALSLWSPAAGESCVAGTGARGLLSYRLEATVALIGLTMIFLAAWRLQHGYLEKLIEGHRNGDVQPASSKPSQG
jgi:hypothetical protein